MDSESWGCANDKLPWMDRNSLTDDSLGAARGMRRRRRYPHLQRRSAGLRIVRLRIDPAAQYRRHSFGDHQWAVDLSDAASGPDGLSAHRQNPTLYSSLIRRERDRRTQSFRIVAPRE